MVRSRFGAFDAFGVLSTPGGSAQWREQRSDIRSDIYTAGMCNAFITASYGGIIHALLTADGWCFYGE
jgi:hypothetical protein